MVKLIQSLLWTERDGRKGNLAAVKLVRLYDGDDWGLLPVVEGSGTDYACKDYGGHHGNQPENSFKAVAGGHDVGKAMDSSGLTK